MYMVIEMILLLAYYATKEEVYEFFLLSRRVHSIRQQRFVEFAELCYPKSEYDGEPEDYWHDATRYYHRQYLMLLVILVLIIAASAVESIPIA